MNEVYVKKALNMGTWTYFFINVITLGFFFYYYQYKLSNILKEVTTEQEDVNLIDKLHKQSTIAISSGIVGSVITLINIFAESVALDLVSNIILLVSSVLIIFWSFTARKVLRIYAAKNFGIDVNPNGFLIFFFPGITLTYSINNIENEIALKNMKEKM